MKDLNPSNNQHIFSTEWFVDPKHPLIQTKVFYANLGNIMYYTTVHRGPTTDDLEMANGEVKAIELNDTQGFDDDETKAYNMLVKHVEKKS